MRKSLLGVRSVWLSEKEVTVYYKLIGDKTIVLTVKARYGKSFERRGEVEV